jgi:hypothetical protein
MIARLTIERDVDPRRVRTRNRTQFEAQVAGLLAQLTQAEDDYWT